MKEILIFLCLLYSFPVLACGEKVENFRAFAQEFETNQPKGTTVTYLVYVPVQKGDFYLRSLSATIKDEFDFYLDIEDSSTYVGDFYESFITIAPSKINDVELVLSYNTTRKDRKNLVFCGNYKTLKFSELIDVETPAKRPELPPPPPPSR